MYKIILGKGSAVQEWLRGKGVRDTGKVEKHYFKSCPLWWCFTYISAGAPQLRYVSREINVLKGWRNELYNL